MTFAAPWVLAGLVFAAVPIILHLLARREPPTVVFPATRYLADATRLHQRRLRLEHLLLLILRTLLIVALVLAAAGPSWPTGGLGAHPPTAAVIVLDNSLSSGAIQAGQPVLETLKDAARAVLGRATADDRLWLLHADGIPRPGSAADLRAVVDTLTPSNRRLDLGAAVTVAGDLLATAERTGEVILISDLQRTALAGEPRDGAMSVIRPAGPPPPNAGIGELAVGSQPWGPEGATVTIVVTGQGEAARPVLVTGADRPARQLLVPVGATGSQKLSGLPAGWQTVTAALDPDELRADDARVAVVRVAPAARVAWPAGDRYLGTAAEVLVQNGRIAAGNEVSLGALGGGASVVLPPEDPARLGALNRALAARGSAWRFGDVSVTAATTDSGPWLGRERLTRRYRLEFQGGAPTDVLVTAGGEPWVVRSGRIVLVGSRFDPEWTSLPLAASFLPFLDALVNRAARGELIQLAGAPGDRLLVPDRVTEVQAGERRWRMEGGAAFVPAELGPHYLVVERDTVGALSVNPDPRESDLARAADDEIRALWPGARFGTPDEAATLAFRAGARSDLRGPLLWAALVLGLAEVALATRRRRAS
ncbi:MAG: BatA domain-containing protein [Gemmatimonadales bacterium]